MKTHASLATIAIFWGTAAHGQNLLSYFERDGLNWITYNSHVAAFTVKPVRAVPKIHCERASQFLARDEVLQECRKDFSKCDEDSKELLREEARNLAFGGTFEEDGKVASYATVNWKISDEATYELNPEQLYNYANILSIDPDKSVVAQIDRGSMSLTTAPDKLIYFKGYVEKEDLSNSWFLQNKLEILSPYEYSHTFLGASAMGNNYFTLSSTFLNCDLAQKSDEYVDIAFNGTMNGLIPVSEQDGKIVQKSYEDLQSIDSGRNLTQIEKAILFGYQLGRTTTEISSKRLDANYLIDKLFAIDSEKVRLKTYENARALQEELSKVRSYQETGSLVRFFPEQ